MRLCTKRKWKFYLVPLELQACPIWCKIPQVGTNDLSRGESEEDLGIGNLLSSCFLHNCEVDGDLGAVGGVPADRAGRGEPPRVMRGTWMTPLVSSWLHFPHQQRPRLRSYQEGCWKITGTVLLAQSKHVADTSASDLQTFIFSTSFLCTFRLQHDFNFVGRGNMLTWTVAGVSWTHHHFLGRGFDCENPNNEIKSLKHVLKKHVQLLLHNHRHFCEYISFCVAKKAFWLWKVCNIQLFFLAPNDNSSPKED